MTTDRQQPFWWTDEGGGVVVVTGHDALELLHRLSTQNVGDLSDGDVRETLFVNEKGRSIALASLSRTGEGVFLYTWAKTHALLIDWLERYTIMEDCSYEDRSAQFTHHHCFGGLPVLPELESLREGVMGDITLAGVRCRALRCPGVTQSIVRLIVPSDASGSVRVELEASAPFLSNDDFHLWRCRAVCPLPGYEIGAHANPLESGAGGAVSFTKGCYIGQEVIARLDSYDKVQRHVTALRFDGDASGLVHGAVLTEGDSNAGYVTTVVYDQSVRTWVGLGLVRTAFRSAGSALRCGQLDVVVTG